MADIQRPRSRDLIDAAGERDVLSSESVAALQSDDVVKQIEAGMAGSQTVTKPGRITLVTLSPDDSGSIFTEDGDVDEVRQQYTDKSDKIIAGHNALLKGMLDGPQGRRTMLHTRYLNGKVLNPFKPLALCQDMSRSQYHHAGWTPLYTQSLVTLGIVQAKAEELTARGARVISATLFMTDGQATDWSANGQEQLSSVISDMRAQNTHIIAGMGIGSQEARFRQTFDAMGIDPDLVFLAKEINEILEAFNMFGKKIEELTAGTSTEVGRPAVFQM